MAAWIRELVPSSSPLETRVACQAMTGVPVAFEWLNDAVKGFLLGPDPFDTEIFEVPGLHCEVASPEMVLVLKCLAHRIGEDDDVRLLAAKAGLVSAEGSCSAQVSG